MERAERVLDAARSMVKDGQKPSAERIAAESGIPEQDVHRCLNHLERLGEVRTYTKEMLGSKLRMVGVNR
jgi:DNA-binding IclR family transcriptional regulator